VALRSLRVGSIAEDIVATRKETPQFVQLGEVKEMRTEPDIQFRINQGVNKQREQTKIFKLENTGEKTEVQMLSGCISSDFERDIEPYRPKRIHCLGKQAGNGEIGEEFIEVWVARTFTSKSSTRLPQHQGD